MKVCCYVWWCFATCDLLYVRMYCYVKMYCYVLLCEIVLLCAACDYVFVCATMPYYELISETMCYYVLLCVSICNYVWRWVAMCDLLYVRMYCYVLICEDVLLCAASDCVFVCATMPYYELTSETMCYSVLLCVSICNYLWRCVAMCDVLPPVICYM
jgi:hypothetical protein